MKEGWEYKKLGDVCEIYQPQTIASNLLKKDGQYPVFGANGMIGRYDSYNHEDSEVLLCCRGATCGAINVSLPFSWINGNAMVVRPINDSFLKSFLRYLLLTLDYSHIITGAAQPQITRKSISPVSVPVPPLSEQQSIVDYLDSSFAKIDAVKANAEKALNEAKALFQASLKEMLEPKEGWEEKKFGKICDFVRGPFGGSLKKECFKDSGYAVYEQQNAIYNKFSFRYFIDEEKYNSLIRFRVNAGDLIMSCSGTIGKVAIIPETFIEGIINQALLKLSPNKDIDAHFLKYLMESNLFKEIINANIEGVAIKNIASVAVLKEIKLYIPTISEQQKIVVEIDSLKSKVDRLQANFEKMSHECDALKQAILKQVFE